MRNLKSQKSKTFWTLLFVGLIGSGCGQQAYREGEKAANVPAATTGSGSSPGTTPTVPVPGTGTATGALNPNSAPNYTFDYSLQGGSASFRSGTVTTDNVLRVTVTAGDPTTISGASGWTAVYNCERVSVTVLGMTQSAFVKRPGAYDKYIGYFGYDPCASAQESQTLDFSARLGQGTNTVTIQVSNPSYDNCYGIYNDPYSGGCGPLRPVYQSHSVKGSLSIETNSLH